MVTLTLLYGRETRTIKSRINAADLKFFRTIDHKTIKDQIRYEVFGNKFKIKIGESLEYTSEMTKTYA